MKLIASALGVLLISSASAGDDVATRIENAMNGDHRSAEYIARNQYRHPVETLTFFGLEDGMTVLEIWPGGGWYTEVLAPTMHDHGKLLVAGYDVSVPGQPEYRYDLQKRLLRKFEERPDLYDQVEVVPFSPPQSASLGDADTIDMVVTFRNTHNWIRADMAEGMFAEFYRVLKPGGVLGVVQHRAPAGSDPDETVRSGYVPERYLIEVAEAAGFEYEEHSQVNANPKDSKDHPEGVWTLPPSLRLGDKDRDKYLAIGESDRMTLRFRKPKD
ncbi:MAG: methyltransferase domain-containing protein [Gammaproteobacteria bacterium]